jgi:hypothetical protein
VVVGSATVKPGEVGTIKVSVSMHAGMDGPHLFHIFVKSSDSEKPVSLLKVKADIVPLETWMRSHPRAFYLPRDVANFPLRSEVVGIDAIAYARRAFGPNGQIRNAYLGKYQKDKQQVQLVVSEFTDSEKAKHLFSEVTARMKENSGASKHNGRIEVEGNPVYASKNKAHEFFYFQSGNKVVWLFPDGSVAKQSIEEVMKHIQRIGM